MASDEGEFPSPAGALTPSEEQVLLLILRGNVLLPLACTVVCTVLATVDERSSTRSREPRDFDPPDGDAADTLRRFATASGEQIVFLVETVRGECTKAVVGKFSAQEALERMLSGTALVMSRDSATGAFFVGRKRPATTTLADIFSPKK